MNQEKKKIKFTATVGFWLVLGATEKYPLIVCPALIKDSAVEGIEELSIQKAWSVSVQAPPETQENAIMTMVPEIINIANLNKSIKEFKSLWEIPEIKTKCEILATKYIERYKSITKKKDVS